MSFIQRELERLQRVMGDPANGNRYAELYAAQQALSWALEPNGIASPMKMLMGIPGDSEGCSSPKPA